MFFGIQTRHVFVAFSLSVLAACTTTRPPQISRVDPRTQIDLSGRWNDTDARLTGDSLISECFGAGWLAEFDRKTGRKPSVRVRGIANKTDEHIDAEVFIKSIERAMVNSGRVSVLAQAGEEQDALEAEQVRADSGAQAPGTTVKRGGEKGADFVISVRMASVLDEIEGRSVKFYKVTLELIDPTTAEKAWIGDVELKKLVSQKKVKW